MGKHLTFTQRVKSAVSAFRVKEYSEYHAATNDYGYTIDSDEADYRKISQTKRDLAPLKLERAVELSYAFAEMNPLAGQLIQIPIAAIESAGVEFKAADDRVSELWEAWYGDKFRGFRKLFMNSRERSILRDTFICGEMNLPFSIQPYTGKLDVAWIDPTNIETILSAPGNAMDKRYVVLKPQVNLPEEKRKFEIARMLEDGSLVGNIFHAAINTHVNASRGRPFLMPLLDWLSVFDQHLFGDLERAAAMKTTIWDVTLRNFDEPKIKNWVAQRYPNGAVPKPLTVNAHNENETWEAKTPDLKAGDSVALADLVRRYIAGGAGLHDFMLGFGQNVNVATARESMISTVWIIESWQRFVQSNLEFMFACVLSAASSAGRELESGRLDDTIDREFTLKMPSVFPRDLVQLSSTATQIVSSTISAVGDKLLSRKTGREAVIMAYNQLMGTEISVDEEIERLDAEEQEALDEPADIDLNGLLDDNTNGNGDAMVYKPTSAELVRMSAREVYTKKRMNGFRKKAE